MSIPDFVIAAIGSILLGFIGKYIKSIKGNLLRVVKATDEFLDIIRVALEAAEDNKLTSEEIKNIKKEVDEFRRALKNE